MRADPYAARNEAVRRMLRASITAAGRLFERRTRRRIDDYRGWQAELRRRYRIAPDTPIHTYDAHVRNAIEHYAREHPEARFAYTSGSTAQPKKIAFTPARLRTIKAGSLSVAARMLLRRQVRRAALFVLSGLDEDDSLTALILADRGPRVPYVEGLLMPAKHLRAPAVQPLIDRYGATAARLWLITLSDPGIFYSTNPSTLALFLGEVHDDWRRTSALVRALHRVPETFSPAVHELSRRVAAPGWEQRFARIADTLEPPPIAEWAPGLEIYCCWDGGYVTPFLDRIRAFLAPERYQLVPMYSMSTETVETLTWFDGDAVRFLPIADDVLYEFLPEGVADDPAALLGAHELAPGRCYTMVVSDCYGLTRYQTEDLFRCVARVGEAPDLRFLRRQGLSYSFTGEKLTDQQLTTAFATLRAALPVLPGLGIQLTMVPCWPDASAVPGYRLVLAHPRRERPPELHDAVAADAAARLDALLCSINRELAGKLASGRLAATRPAVMSYDRLATALDPKTRDQRDVARRSFDTQFKLLPLYRRLWHEYGFEPDPDR